MSEPTKPDRDFERLLRAHFLAGVALGIALGAIAVIVHGATI